MTRIAGADRFATAAMISARYFAAGAPVAYVATGRSFYATAAAVSRAAFPADSGGTVHVASGVGFADAVAGVPAVAVHGGPLLLTTRTWLPDATRVELRRLDPRRVVLLRARAASRG